MRSVTGAGLRARRSRTILSLAFALACLEVIVVASAAGTPVITAAGDIARGRTPSRHQRQTARLVRSIDPTAVLTLGDNQYPEGAFEDFEASYDPTWGRFKHITRPVPGNHEYLTHGAAGYFRYFGRRAHRSRGGFYSFDIGAWHLVAVNSGPGSISRRQLTWIRRDLRRDDGKCDLAYWHHPRWSSGLDGPDRDMAPLWRLLVRQGVDVVANGHRHQYERFAPLSFGGRVDRREGIREFVVGTGGASLSGFGDPVRGSQRRIADVFGVLRLGLRQRGYTWAFVGTDGAVRDRGRHGCHA